ncbi:MAG: hypothetical protein R2713_06185 [Ilumatobacteraceae bacterium]
MVTEAVGEMKGEPAKAPSEVKLDVPTDAFRWLTTWRRRSCGWRPTAARSRAGERGGRHPRRREDRYGPVPDPASAARRRLPGAECHRLGLGAT